MMSSNYAFSKRGEQICNRFDAPRWLIGPGNVHESIEFSECRFENCYVTSRFRPRQRTVFRNIRLIDCTQENCRISTSIIEDVLLSGLPPSSSGFSLSANAYRHVVVEGDIHGLGMSATPSPIWSDSKNRHIMEDNREYYQTVDWALDIRNATFANAVIRGIPLELIRRNPDCHIILSKEDIHAKAWRDIDFETNFVEASFFFSPYPEEDVLLVAPQLEPNFDEVLRDFERLHRSGITR